MPHTSPTTYQIGDDIVSATVSNTSETTAPADPATPDTLRVLSVLASGLPAEVGTPDEPPLYTVPAVFSRRVTSKERSRIEDPATAELLMARTGAGPGLELAVSDRRLLIRNTNLGQLRDGLAAAIGEMLHRIVEELLTEQDERDSAAVARLARDAERADAVARAAAEIRFGPVGDELDEEARPGSP